MCGRFASIKAIEELAKKYNALPSPDTKFTGSYNIAPTEKAPIIHDLEKSDSRILELASFGMKMTVQGKSFPLLNRQSEKVANLEDFKSRRCIIPASGFFEWEKVTPKEKQPYYFSPKDNELFSFAGFWRHDANGLAFTILTTSANDLVNLVHARMPVILGHNAVGLWLDTNSDKTTLTELLQPYPAELMQSWKVSKTVNSPKNKEALCINSL